MELLIFEAEPEDRRKNPFQIPEGSETEYSALAGLIRSHFLVNLFTNDDMYKVFTKMEKEENLTDEGYNMVLLSNAIQKANMSSSAYRVDLEEFVDELLNRKRQRIYDIQEKSDFVKINSVVGALIKNYLKFEAKYVENDDDDDESDHDSDEDDSDEDESEDSDDEGKKKKKKEENKGNSNLDFRLKIVKVLRDFQNNLKNLVNIKALLEFLMFESEDEAISKARAQIEHLIRTLYFKGDKTCHLSSNNLLQIYISFPFLYFSDSPITKFRKILKSSPQVTPDSEPEEESKIKFWETYSNLRKCFKTLSKFMSLASSYSTSGVKSSKTVDQDLKEMITYTTPHMEWMHSPFNETYSISVVSLFSNTGQNVEVIDVRVTDGRDMKFFEDVKLSKLDSSQGFNVFDLINEINDMSSGSGEKKGMFDNKFYLPSVSIDDSIRTLLVDEDRGYGLKDFEYVDFHRIPTYNYLEDIKLGSVGALYIDLLDEDGNVLRTLNCLLSRQNTLNDQFEKIHNLFNLHSLNLKSSYIKKYMKFDDDSIGWFNKFGDYLDVVKGFDEKPCSPVFQIELKDIVRRRLKDYNFKKSKDTGIGRLGIGDMLRKNVKLSVGQLEKLGKKF